MARTVILLDQEDKPEITTVTLEVAVIIKNKVVFSSAGNRVFELYMMNADGFSPFTLTNNGDLTHAFSAYFI